jgi:predicted peroxiredoxin
MKRIIVEIKNVYGNDMIYPINDDAKIFASIAGTKTLTKDTVVKIKTLGYEVKCADQIKL